MPLGAASVDTNGMPDFDSYLDTQLWRYFMSQPETRWYYVVLRHRETGETVRPEVEAVNSDEAVQLALEECDWTERETEVMEWEEINERSRS